jgi:hypothetical protein
MTNNYDPSFYGVENIGSTLLLGELENNYKSFLDWGFLKIGAYTNVTRPTINISSFDLHKLKPTKDNLHNNNTVWQAARKDWVYETGVMYNSRSPINISGVYVNSTFYPGPTGNSTIGYKINYPEGKVIFNKSVSPTSTIEVEYSYRNIQIYKMEEFPYWREIQFKSLENKVGLSLSDTGDFSIGSEHRVQLPAIIIEPVANSNNKPFRLGDKSLIIDQDILLHVISDQPKDKNNIIDILRVQEDKVLWLYKTDTIIKSGVYPLNYDGSKNNSGQNYDLIVNNNSYKWLTCRIIDVTISDINFMNIRTYGSVVRLSNQIIFTSF